MLDGFHRVYLSVIEIDVAGAESALVRGDRLRSAPRDSPVSHLVSQFNNS